MLLSHFADYGGAFPSACRACFVALPAFAPVADFGSVSVTEAGVNVFTLAVGACGFWVRGEFESAVRLGGGEWLWLAVRLLSLPLIVLLHAHGWVALFVEASHVEFQAL